MEIKYWELIAKYLSEDSSAEEKEELFAWVKAAPENEAKFRNAQSMWRSLKKKEALHPDIDQSWEQMKERLLSQEKETKIYSRHPAFYTKWLAAACIVLLVGIGSVFLWNSFEKNSYQTLTTGSDIEYIVLPDSSKVWLNKNSQLKYFNHLENERIVYLEGEAFFEVKRDSSRPFFVHTQNTTTRILGTSFNIRAYEQEENVELTVATGKVEFSSKSGKNRKVILFKNDKAIAGKKLRQIQKKKNDNPDYIAWKNNNRRSETKKPKRHKQEIANPRAYLSSEFTWRDNLIKQTIIVGKIHNTSIFTRFKTIRLKATYTSKEGTHPEEEYFTIYRTVQPGEFIDYKFRLSNWLENTTDVKLQIVDARVAQ